MSERIDGVVVDPDGRSVAGAMVVISRGDVNTILGGGLGIDYEGSQSSNDCSINYDLRAYAVTGEDEDLRGHAGFPVAVASRITARPRTATARPRHASSRRRGWRAC